MRLIRGELPEIRIRRAFPSQTTSIEEGDDLIAVAVYGDSDWKLVHDVIGDAPVVVVATHCATGDAERALAAGAFGLIDLEMPPAAMRRALLGALAGEPAYSRRLIGDLIRRRSLRAREANAMQLTPRQREVLALIAQGAADKEIALTLRIATGTAQKHVTNLLRKLGVPNRAAAVASSFGTQSFLPAPVDTRGSSSEIYAYPSRVAVAAAEAWSPQIAGK